MIYSSPQRELQSISQPTIQAKLWKALKQFWKFSSFYGDYVSLPAAERRKFVNKLNSTDSIPLDRIQK